MPLSTALFDYDLPARLIAQFPAVRRDESRLLVVDRADHTIAHHRFSDLPQFLRAGDTLFRNNAAVLPARLLAHRPTGGQVECFLLRPIEGLQLWLCLVKPGKKLPVGATFAHGTGAFRGEIVGRFEDGSAHVRFTTPHDEPIVAVAKRMGEVPLPPYIQRPATGAEGKEARPSRAADLERYQTVYADRTQTVAVAAPTAGLHFTPELFARLQEIGVRTADLTLHVGLGTFKPITSETVEEHPIHREIFELPIETQRALFPPLSGRRIAVGTTSVRTVEAFLADHASPLVTSQTYIGEAGIFIYPPQLFRGVEALITNFHQPRSTLLCLVAAFLSPGKTDGVGWLHEIYAAAIAQEYRFFSYGDAMLIL